MTSLFDPTRVCAAPQDGGDPDGPLGPGTLEEIELAVARQARRESLTSLQQGHDELYPMRASLVQVSAEADRLLAAEIPPIHEALVRIVRAHREDEELRGYLAVPPALLRWVDLSPPEDCRIDFCRFDLVGGTLEDLGVVEFNANNPGGALYTGDFKALWRADPRIGALLESWSVRSERMDRPDWFTDFVLEVTGPAARLAIFHQPGGNVLELDRLAAELGRRAVPAVLTSPAAPGWAQEGIEAGYLKYGVQATLADLADWNHFLKEAVSGGLRLVNPPAGRWVGDSKLCLAVMSDPRFGRLFTRRQQEAIDRLIPYSRKAGDGVSAAELRDDRPDWVVKGPYDTRGNSVFIGAEHPAPAWDALVARAVESGWLAQRLIRPGGRRWGGADRYQDLSIVLLGGRMAGYMSRISSNLRVNVAQGGGRQLVYGHASVRWPS